MVKIEMRTIYIAGKITGVGLLNKPAFYAAENKLRFMGYGRVLNPHVICKELGGKSKWFLYMRKCIRSIADSDEVTVLGDWKNSRGAVIEVLIAMFLHIPVLAIETLKPIKKYVLWFHIIKFIILHPFAYVNKN